MHVHIKYLKLALELPDGEGNGLRAVSPSFFTGVPAAVPGTFDQLRPGSFTALPVRRQNIEIEAFAYKIPTQRENNIME